MREIKRQVAFKVKINEILNGEYKKEDGWQPNYLITEYGKISRVNVIAVLVSKNEDEKSFMLDDGSGKIAMRTFENKNFDVDVGDIVLAIGRPREWNFQKYIMPEIIKRMKDKRWVEVRKLELEERKKIKKSYIEVKEEVVLSPYQKILDLINMLDSGEGADFQDVLIKSKINDGEKILNNLLEQGEVFEVRPGKLKILE